MRFVKNRQHRQLKPRYQYQLSNISNWSNPRFNPPNLVVANNAAEKPLVSRNFAWNERVVCTFLLAMYIFLGLYTSAFVITAFPGRSFLFESNFADSFALYQTNLQLCYVCYLVYPVMFIWNAVWVLWVFMDRWGFVKRFLCFCPSVVDSLVQVEFCFGILFTILTMQLMDSRQIYGKLWSSLMALASFTASNLAVGFCMQKYQEYLMTHLNGVYWTLKLATQNGIAALVSLTLLECMFSVHAILIDPYFGFASNFSTTVLLSALSLAIVCYFIIDILLVETCTRFVITPYCVIAGALCTIVLVKSEQNSFENIIFLVVLVCSCTVLAGIRFLVGLVNERHSLFLKR